MKKMAAAMMAVMMVLLFSTHAANAANGQLVRGDAIQSVPANVTVSGDIEISGGQKFYDGRGTPTVVYFCQATPIIARFGGSWVSLDETRPEVVAARNNAQLQTYPGGCQVPATVAGLLVSQPPPVQAIPVVTTVVAPVQAGACPPIRPGALTPAVVIRKASNPQGYEVLCGALPQFECPTAWANMDIPISPGQKVTLSPCMVVNGDIIWRGVPQYLGGVQGEETDMEIAFPAGGTIFAGYGANAYPGGPNEALSRCLAKFAEGSKTVCMIVDPPADGAD